MLRATDPSPNIEECLYVIKKFKSYGTEVSLPKCGRNRKFYSRREQKIVEMVEFKQQLLLEKLNIF